MTRLCDVRVDVLEVPFRVPLRASDRHWTTRRLAIVRLIAEDRLEGIGEVAASGPGGLPAPIPDELRGLFAGLDPAETTDLEARLRDTERWGGIGRALRSALETAVADLAARAAGVSVAASIGVGVRPRVLLNGLVGIDTPDRAARAAASLAAAGFECLKMKVGDEPPTVIAARIRAVRAAVGPSVRLRLDANGAWSGPAEALAAIDAVAGFDLEFVEQPLPPDLGPHALASLRRVVPMPLAADEAVTDPDTALALLEAGAADVLVVKPARVGGFRQARRIADVAAASGVPIVVSTLFETGIGVAAALHLAATLEDDSRAHGLATAGLLATDLLAEPLPIANGHMTLPSGPGLGVRLDPVAVERYRVR